MAQAVLAEWGSPAAADSARAQLADTYAPNQPAALLGEPLQAFCACMLEAVQRQLAPLLAPLRSAVVAAETTRVLSLRLHATLTVSRAPADAEYRGELLHADAFDGTVLGLAFVCSKMGTRLYPQASFVEPPLEQFLRESRGGMRNGFSRVVEGAQGEMRPLAPRQLMILPAAVAHARPDGRVDAHPPAAAPRWFARAHLELRPAGGPKAWDERQRMAVALLVAEHVWRDAGFLAAARERLGNGIVC